MSKQFDEAAKSVLETIKNMSPEDLKAKMAAQQGGVLSQMADDMEGFVAFLADEEKATPAQQSLK